MSFGSRRFALALAIALPMAAQAAGVVTVAVADTARFTDAGSGPAERDANLAVLTRQLQSLGAQLPDGQTLAIELLDVDLAGRPRPSRRGSGELRILNGRTDWPRIELRYVLVADGRELRSGRENLSDMNYLRALRGEVSNAKLRYEQHMLEAWFKAEFVTARSSDPR